MFRIKQAVIVEGTYDHIKLSGFIDGIIIKTDGFSIFHDKDKIETIKTLAKKTGIVILTDSDSAGFKIRNFIKQAVLEGEVLSAYVPDIRGKEKRKLAPSKEGLLGVEGINAEIIISALKASGCEINGEKTEIRKDREITKTDLYIVGLSGKDNSSEKRYKLCRELGLPAKISANMLVNAMNRLMTYDEFLKYAEEL